MKKKSINTKKTHLITGVLIFLTSGLLLLFSLSAYFLGTDGYWKESKFRGTHYVLPQPPGSIKHLTKCIYCTFGLIGGIYIIFANQPSKTIKNISK